MCNRVEAKLAAYIFFNLWNEILVVVGRGFMMTRMTAYGPLWSNLIHWKSVKEELSYAKEESFLPFERTRMKRLGRYLILNLDRLVLIRTCKTIQTYQTFVSEKDIKNQEEAMIVASSATSTPPSGY